MGLRTLVAEDDPHQRRRISEVLTEMGLDVVAVQDAERGLVEHLRSPFDLFVIDWVMPVMDGLTATRHIRNNPDIDQPYIIAVTANAMEEDRQHCKEAGMDGFVAKPVTLDHLSAEISRCIPSVASVG